MRGQPGFFDVEDRLTRLSDLGDQPEAFTRVVDFEMFRPELEAGLDDSDRAKGGRPPFDPVLMFKILVIQASNNLRRARRVPDQRPPVVHAFPRAGARRQGARRQDDLDLP